MKVRRSIVGGKSAVAIASIPRKNVSKAEKVHKKQKNRKQGPPDACVKGGGASKFLSVHLHRLDVLALDLVQRVRKRLLVGQE